MPPQLNAAHSVNMHEHTPASPPHLRQPQVVQQRGLALVAQRGPQPPHFRVKDGAALRGGPQLPVQLGALAQVRRHGCGWGRGNGRAAVGREQQASKQRQAAGGGSSSGGAAETSRVRSGMIHRSDLHSTVPPKEGKTPTGCSRGRGQPGRRDGRLRLTTASVQACGSATRAIGAQQAPGRHNGQRSTRAQQGRTCGRAGLPLPLSLALGTRGSSRNGEGRGAAGSHAACGRCGALAADRHPPAASQARKQPTERAPAAGAGDGAMLPLPGSSARRRRGWGRGIACAAARATCQACRARREPHMLGRAAPLHAPSVSRRG